jgi:hypothetical protein
LLVNKPAYDLYESLLVKSSHSPEN